MKYHARDIIMNAIYQLEYGDIVSLHARSLVIQHIREPICDQIGRDKITWPIHEQIHNDTDSWRT